MNNWFSYVIDQIFPEILIMQTLGLIWNNNNIPDQELYLLWSPIFQFS